ncbi:hypothetical protein RRG08_065517 [Elysia crispata]|uniref:Uncharacterized protein n=1 Tax=Elysia crispata TaxID=231223 RepID=A0AAE1B655_9GAST|nr:hypothetical protein RRG08_065517 [Elysia crispata]
MLEIATTDAKCFTIRLHGVQSSVIHARLIPFNCFLYGNVDASPKDLKACSAGFDKKGRGQSWEQSRYEVDDKNCCIFPGVQAILLPRIRV